MKGSARVTVTYIFYQKRLGNVRGSSYFFTVGKHYLAAYKFPLNFTIILLKKYSFSLTCSLSCSLSLDNNTFALGYKFRKKNMHLPYYF